MNEHMCVPRFVQLLKGQMWWPPIAFCLASLWNASSRGQQKLWPKSFSISCTSHFISLSHHFGESFIAKITALEMQSTSSHHKNLYTQNPQLDDQGVFIWSIDKVSVGWLLVRWVVFFGCFSHNRSFWVFEKFQRTNGFLKEHEKKISNSGVSSLMGPLILDIEKRSTTLEKLIESVTN